MAIEWNFGLKLGLAVLIAVSFLAVWLAVKSSVDQPFPKIWVISLAVLGVLSLSTMFVSQVKVVSSLTWGEGDNVEGETTTKFP